MGVGVWDVREVLAGALGRVVEWILITLPDWVTWGYIDGALEDNRAVFAMLFCTIRKYATRV